MALYIQLIIIIILQFVISFFFPVFNYKILDHATDKCVILFSGAGSQNIIIYICESNRKRCNISQLSFIMKTEN